MSTGPGPTRKADGTADASVEEIADLLVESEEPAGRPQSEDTPHDNLDVMLETPGPMVASSFLPPPPSPVGDAGDDGEGAEEAGGATNLAYEDLLAKLVLPAKAPEPAAEMPAVVGTLPMPEPDEAMLSTPAMAHPPGQSLQVAPPAEERTLVTDNPLIAEEQEAAYREGRTATRDQPVVAPLSTAPVMAGGVVAKSKLVYLMLGGLLVLGGMILAVLVLKLLMPTPAPQPAPVVMPATPPPPPSAPAHVVPLPPSIPPPAVVPIPAEPAVAAAPAVVPSEPEKPAPKVHRKAPRQLAPKAPRAAAPKPTPPAAPKPPKSKKSSRSTGFADPFDN